MPAIRYAQSVVHDARAALTRVRRDRVAWLTIALIGLPWLFLYPRRQNFDWLWSFGEMIVMVLAMWWMSRSGAQNPPVVKHPRAESLFAIVLIVAWMIWRAGICGKLFPFLPADLVCFKNIEFEIIPKVLEMVVLPVGILFLLGYRWRAQGLDFNRRAWWIALPILGVTILYGMYAHWNDLAGFGQRTLEFFFAAGLPEEVLFRAILLTRLEAWWRNSAWALLGSSLIFGLSHLPINFLVFTSRDFNEAVVIALTIQMGLGAAFAFGYQRMRNVMPLAVLHALVDAL